MSRGATDRPAPINGIDAVLGALELLDERDRVTIGDVAAALGLSRSAAHRLMTALTRAGYAVLGRSGRGYSPGRSLFAMSKVPALDPAVRLRLRPVLQTLRERTGESVHSAVLTGDHVLVVDGRRSAYSADIGLRIGMTAPANTMAAGKLLLAAMRDEGVEALMPTPMLRRSPQSIATMDRLLPELDAIRRLGWCRAVQESEPGVNSIAVPLDGATRATRLALVVSVPLKRGRPHRLAELAAAASDVVAEFAARGVVTPWRLRR
ncbi:IclR family transcriptional regulator [Gryllotalpicola sp.]|uniref:IclR family transcriptional regulator n=1 Tax=Gryllotalpicola sp. TaxID=1932787 RepID=UPI002628B915|nr:IclR family transcriptional regulator [Gryllotalpicola sp.]